MFKVQLLKFEFRNRPFTSINEILAFFSDLNLSSSPRVYHESFIKLSGISFAAAGIVAAPNLLK